MEIPSDFDYSLLLPSTDPNYPDEADLPPRCEAEEFDDELDALHALADERRQLLCKQGVVIQHRQWDGRPVFRSSSLPPGVSLRVCCGVVGLGTRGRRVEYARR